MRMLKVLAVVLLAGVLSAQAQSTAQKLAENKAQISLADARSRIDKAIEKPEVMTEIVRHLSAEDQKQFLADVNKAISDPPASDEEKAAKFLNVNHAALKGAAKGNVAVLLAEVFATVPPEALTVISERFAVDLLSRTADATMTYTDEQFTEISLAVMKKVVERCNETDNGAPRAAFAIVMLLRASNGAPADLGEKLIETLPTAEAREMARTEWIPFALGQDGRQQSYEPLLGSADAGRRPDLDFVLVIAGPQFDDCILFDLLGKSTDKKAYSRAQTPVTDAVESVLRHAIPIIGGDLSDRADTKPYPDEVKERLNPTPTPEPEPYPGQILH